MKKTKPFWKLMFEEKGPKTIRHRKYGRIVKPRARQLTRRRETHKNSSGNFWIAIVAMIVIGLITYSMVNYWQSAGEVIEEPILDMT